MLICYNELHLDGKRILLYPMKSETQKLEEKNPLKGKNPDWEKQTDSLLHEESIAESGRIFIRNLPFITTEEELQAIFEKYGMFLHNKEFMFNSYFKSVCVSGRSRNWSNYSCR